MKAIRVTNQRELDAAYHIRKVVFVEEQGVPQEVELDEHDAKAEHILVYDQDQPVGTARWRNVDGAAKFERICVLASHRKHGVGKVIIEALEQSARNKGLSKAKLHGQTQAELFYRKLGYQPASDVFFEEGIPHILMVKELGEQ